MIFVNVPFLFGLCLGCGGGDANRFSFLRRFGTPRASRPHSEWLCINLSRHCTRGSIGKNIVNLGKRCSWQNKNVYGIRRVDMKNLQGLIWTKIDKRLTSSTRSQSSSKYDTWHYSVIQVIIRDHETQFDRRVNTLIFIQPTQFR